VTHFIFILEIKLNKNDWEIVQKGWPIRDEEDEKPHQFHFKRNLKPVYLQLNKKMIDQIADKILEPMKVSFKVINKLGLILSFNHITMSIYYSEYL
jgi:hypothetical protein